MMDLTVFSKEVHENAVDHGCWEDELSIGEIIALCHSELSEALGEDGKGNPLVWYRCHATDEEDALEGTITICGGESTHDCELRQFKWCEYKDEKPEGVAVELADCILRILDYCGKEDIDIEDIIRRKHEYNKARR